MNGYEDINKKLKQLNIKEITYEELEKISSDENKSMEEIIQNIKFALKDLEYTKGEISKIIKENNYVEFPNNMTINNYGKEGELNLKYLCSDHLEQINGIDIKDLALVTGFGPTNSPTAGTLSMIFRIIEMQKKTGIFTHIIISDLGAFNSRQKPIEELIKRGKQFKKFIIKLGFDTKNGIIRTHNDYDHARTFALASSVLTINDFINHDEATADMYKRLNLQGNDFSTMVDQTFTVSDIILPIIRYAKKGVIVSAGIEEHYYPQLSNIVLDRLKSKKGKVGDLIPQNAFVSAVYGKLINGLFPYVKMSKSIPQSAINIGDSESEIKEKIMNCSDRNEEVILQMIELASNWNINEIKDAKYAFENRKTNKELWTKTKEKYCDFILDIKKLWDECEEEIGDLRDEIFF